MISPSFPRGFFPLFRGSPGWQPRPRSAAPGTCTLLCQPWDPQRVPSPPRVPPQSHPVPLDRQDLSPRNGGPSGDSSREIRGVGRAPLGSGGGSRRAGSAFGIWDLGFEQSRDIEQEREAANRVPGSPRWGGNSCSFPPLPPPRWGGKGRCRLLPPRIDLLSGTGWLRWEMRHFGTRGPVPVLFPRLRAPQNEPGRCRGDAEEGPGCAPHPPPPAALCHEL